MSYAYSTNNDNLKVAVVTGGGSGIGHATCVRLAAQGYHVYSLDVSIGAYTDDHLISEISVDVTKGKDLEKALFLIESEFGFVDVLVNCAGILETPKKPEDISFDDWRRMIDVDLTGVFNSCKVFKPLLSKKKSSSVVNIASIAGSNSMPLHSYSTAKSAVIMLTRNLSAAWGEDNIRVNSVSPGFTLTPALQAQISNGNRNVRSLEKHSSMGRMVTVDEVVDVINFLISDSATAVTGVDIPADCGWSQKCTWVSHEL